MARLKRPTADAGRAPSADARVPIAAILGTDWPGRCALTPEQHRVRRAIEQDLHDAFDPRAVLSLDASGRRARDAARAAWLRRDPRVIPEPAP